jgi:uncharacterized membrane protein YraQ (UPF0718 family)
MLPSMIYGLIFRGLISLIEAAPFILAGFFTAAIFRRFCGYETTRRLFGEGTRWALVRAWLLGMLLPVCSLGVIPVVRELRRAGIRGGTILAFAISGPLFNPLSLLYGLTLSEPVAILSFAGCSLLIVTVAGILWDRFFPDSATHVVQEPMIQYGYRRMLSLLLTTARDTAGACMGWILLGLLGVGLLGAVLPSNGLQHAFNADNPVAPLLMAGLALPVYATPMLAMSQLGSMFQHANSIGAAFVLLILGAGVNLGGIGWMYAEFGFRRTSVWLLVLLSIVLGLAYSVDKPLFPRDVEPANHTHAFDIYCRPFADTELNPALAFQTKLERDVPAWQWRPLMLLTTIAVSGLILKVVDRQGRLDRWLEQPNESAGPGRYDTVIPAPVLGLLCLSGLVAVSIAGCFTYYPNPADSLEVMTDARIGALSAALTMNPVETKYWAERYDDWSRKLEVGAWLRHGSLSEYHRWRTRILREQLEELEHEVEDGEREAVTRLVAAISRSHRRMRRAFLEEID